MNKRQVQGIAKEVVGKVQQDAGKVTGSKTQQIKGVGKQISGAAERAVGNLEADVKDAQKQRDRAQRRKQ